MPPSPRILRAGATHPNRHRAPPSIATNHAWVVRALVCTTTVLLAAWYVDVQFAKYGRLGFPMDDPYIHFQFARNLATGHGFAFNPGEPTPGATSPLWILLLALAATIGLPLEWAALGLGVAAAGAIGCLVFEVARKLQFSSTIAAAAAIATVAAGRITWASLSGMETCLATALSLGAVRAHLMEGSSVRRSVLLGFLAGLAQQARPEMILLFPILVFLEWRRGGASTATSATARPRSAASLPRGRALLIFAAAFALVAAPYVVFALVITGRPLPNTFYAKVLIPLEHSGAGLAALRTGYLAELMRWAWLDNPIVAVLVVPGALLWMFWRAVPRTPLVYLWPLAFVAYAIALAPRHFSMSRYTIPLIPYFVLLAAGSLDALAHRLARPGHRAAASLVGATMLVAAACWNQPNFRKIHAGQVSNILSMHVRMAEWVKSHVPPEARIAMNDIGAITFYGRRYCIDTMGLVNHRLVSRQLEARGSGQALDAEAIVATDLREARPQFCILFPEWYPNLTRVPWLRARAENRYPNTTGGADLMVAYEVVGLPPPKREPGAPP